MFYQLAGYISAPQEFTLLLAELDAGTLFYIAIGLLAAISSWLTKRKEAQKRDQLMAQASEEFPPVIGEEQPSSSGNWLDRLEQMVEEAEEAKQSDPPPIIEETEPEAIETYPESGVHVREDRLQTHLNQVPPQLEQTPPSVFQDEPISAQLEAAKVAPGRLKASPIYQSPIYSANIGQQIANDLNAARQGVVASIILNPPKALEDPEKATRY